MSAPNKSKTWKPVPTVIDLPLVPVIADDEKLSREALRGNVRIKGFTTEFTPISEIKELDQRKIHQIKKLCGSEQVIALQRLVDEHPLNALDPWVRECYYKFIKSGRLRRNRGRPKGDRSIEPLLIYGLIEHLLRQNLAKSVNDAFGKLEELGVTTSEIAKNRYLQAKHDPRCKAALLTIPATDPDKVKVWK